MKTRHVACTGWAIAAFAALVTTAAVVPHTNPNFDDSMVSMTPTERGCDITIRAHNRGSTNITIDLEDSEVKVRRGLWKKLNQGGN